MEMHQDGQSMLQTFVAFACLGGFVLTAIGVCFGYPQFRLARHHWRELHPEAQMEDKRTRRMWPFIILIVVGLVVGGLGIFLIAHRPKEAPQQPAGGVTNQPNTAPASQPAASILRQK